MLGANIPASKPKPLFITAELNFFFIFKFQNCENAQRRSQVNGNNYFARANTTRAARLRLNQTKKLRGGGTGG
jgi:hypothetical protein